MSRIRTQIRAGILAALTVGLLFGWLVVPQPPRVGAQSVTSSQSLTITSTAATGLTGVSGSTFCRGVLEGSAIRLALDGGTATGTVGRPVYIGQEIRLGNGADIARFSAISISSSSATLNLYCGAGTTAAVSDIVSPPTNTALPLCNALTRPAGNCR